MSGHCGLLADGYVPSSDSDSDGVTVNGSSKVAVFETVPSQLIKSLKYSSLSTLYTVLHLFLWCACPPTFSQVSKPVIGLSALIYFGLPCGPGKSLSSYCQSIPEVLFISCWTSGLLNFKIQPFKFYNNNICFTTIKTKVLIKILKDAKLKNFNTPHHKITS